MKRRLESNEEYNVEVKRCYAGNEPSDDHIESPISAGHTTITSESHCSSAGNSRKRPHEPEDAHQGHYSSCLSSAGTNTGIDFQISLSNSTPVCDQVYSIAPLNTPQHDESTQHPNSQKKEHYQTILKGRINHKLADLYKKMVSQPESVPWSCPLNSCAAIFPSFFLWHLHTVHAHHEYRMCFICQQCCNVFPSKRSLLDHFNFHHQINFNVKNDSLAVCLVHSKRFFRIKDWDRLFNSSCYCITSNCSMVFPNPRKLINHVRSHWLCRYCNDGFSTKLQVVEHAKHIHSEGFDSEQLINAPWRVSQSILDKRWIDSLDSDSGHQISDAPVCAQSFVTADSCVLNIADGSTSADKQAPILPEKKYVSFKLPYVPKQLAKMFKIIADASRRSISKSVGFWRCLIDACTCPQFSSYKSWRGHARSQHAKYSFCYICPDCGDIYHSVKLLGKHVRLYHQQYPADERLLEATGIVPKGLFNHLQQFCEQRTFICPLCPSDNYTSLNAVLGHVTFAHLWCQVCPSSFDTCAALDEHRREHDASKQPAIYPCASETEELVGDKDKTSCDSVLLPGMPLSSCSTINSGGPSIKCGSTSEASACSKVNAMVQQPEIQSGVSSINDLCMSKRLRDDLNRILTQLRPGALKKGSSWQCVVNECQLQFTSYGLWCDHVTNHHTNLRVCHKCPDCSDAYPTFVLLGMHSRYYHLKDPVNEQLGNSPGVISIHNFNKLQHINNKRQFNCPACGCKNLRSLGAVSAHTSTLHSWCHVCPMSFKSRALLKKHKKGHNLNKSLDHRAHSVKSVESGKREASLLEGTVQTDSSTVDGVIMSEVAGSGRVAAVSCSIKSSSPSPANAHSTAGISLDILIPTNEASPTGYMPLLCPASMKTHRSVNTAKRSLLPKKLQGVCKSIISTCGPGAVIKDEMWECTFGSCSEKFASYQLWVSHLQSSHKKQSICYVCPLCFDIYPALEFLSMHLRLYHHIYVLSEHWKDSMHIIQMPLWISLNELMNQHIYNCPMQDCTVTKSLKALWKHVTGKHHWCDSCPLAFSCEQDLSIHSKHHPVGNSIAQHSAASLPKIAEAEAHEVRNGVGLRHDASRKTSKDIQQKPQKELSSCCESSTSSQKSGVIATVIATFSTSCSNTQISAMPGASVISSANYLPSFTISAASGGPHGGTCANSSACNNNALNEFVTVSQCQTSLSSTADSDLGLEGTVHLSAQSTQASSPGPSTIISSVTLPPVSALSISSLRDAVCTTSQVNSILEKLDKHNTVSNAFSSANQAISSSCNQTTEPLLSPTVFVCSAAIVTGTNFSTELLSSTPIVSVVSGTPLTYVSSCRQSVTPVLCASPISSVPTEQPVSAEFLIQTDLVKSESSSVFTSPTAASAESARTIVSTLPACIVSSMPTVSSMQSSFVPSCCAVPPTQSLSVSSSSGSSSACFSKANNEDTRKKQKPAVEDSYEHSVSVQGSRQFMCMLNGCGKVLVSWNSLFAHRARVHKCKCFKCPFCDSTFTFQNLVLWHVKENHPEAAMDFWVDAIRPVVSSMKGITDMSYVMQKTGYPCLGEGCSEVFDTFVQYEQHQRSVHGISCKYCEEILCNRVQSKKHMALKHKDLM